MGFFDDLLRGINDFFNGLIPMEPSDSPKSGAAPAQLQPIITTPSQPDTTPVLTPLPTSDTAPPVLDVLNANSPSQPEIPPAPTTQTGLNAQVNSNTRQMLNEGYIEELVQAYYHLVYNGGTTFTNLDVKGGAGQMQAYASDIETAGKNTGDPKKIEDAATIRAYGRNVGY